MSNNRWRASRAARQQQQTTPVVQVENPFGLKLDENGNPIVEENPPQEDEGEDVLPVTKGGPPPERVQADVSFNAFYLKRTMHFIPALWEAFEQTSKDTKKSKTRLFNEAMVALLKKYDALDDETKEQLREWGYKV